MTDKRTGFKQASDRLRAVDLRPTKVQFCDGITSISFKWVSLPLASKNSAVTDVDVVGRSDSLTTLCDDAEQMKGKGEGNNPPQIPPSGTELDTLTEIKGKQAQALDLLKGLLGSAPGLDRDAVKAMIQETAGDAIEIATAGMRTEVTNQIQDTIRGIESRLPLKVDIKLPERESFQVEGEHNLFPTLLHEISLGSAVMLCGPAGSGKTTAAEKAGEKLGLTVYIQPPVADRFELLGFIDAGGTYQPSPAYKWAKDPGSLLILDELDRSHPGALCAVHAMLANGIAVFPNGEVRIDPSNRIVATANTWGIGPDAEYTGSARLDAATLNRFSTRLFWGYDSGLETRIAVSAGGSADEAQWVIRMRAELDRRKIRLIWSPRDTVAHCRRVASGIPRRESLERSVLVTLSQEQRTEIQETV